MSRGTHCPACGSPETTPIKGHRDDLSPGEWCDYRCEDCGHVFAAIMPEPPGD